jgi:hypothetical protein
MRLIIPAWLVVVAVGLNSLVFSMHGEAAESIDPTETWKIATINSGTKKRNTEQTLKLKLENGKLTGTMTGRSEVNGNVRHFEWSIAGAQLKETNISFSLSHPPVVGNGSDVLSRYEGGVSRDAMKGKSK